MTVKINDVLCPECGGADCSQIYSEESDAGVYSIWYQEIWKCNTCMHEFKIGCERKLSYYCYVQENGEYSDDHEIQYEEE